jgi:hypothetical protein
MFAGVNMANKKNGMCRFVGLGGGNGGICGGYSLNFMATIYLFK